MIKFLLYLTNLFNTAEDTIINAVSAIVPWLVPIVPAFLTFQHASDPSQLNFPTWVAAITGLVVELLGLASMRTIFMFDEFNRRYKDDKKKAPIWTAIGTYAFYLSVVLLVNVVLDWQKGVSAYKVIAIALLCLLSVPAGVLISVRAQHTERRTEIERERERRRTERAQAKRSAEPKQNGRTVPERSRGSTTPASAFKEQIWGLLERELEAGHKIPGPTAIARELNLNPDMAKGYISTQTKEWAKQKGLIQ